MDFCGPCNSLILLQINTHFFDGNPNILNNSDIYSWMRGRVMICLSLPKQKNFITKKGLACSYYTIYSKNSKMNLPIHEKAMNAEPGLYTLSLRSLSHLLRLRLQTCFDALKVFSGLQAFERNDTILSWHHPRSPGSGFGNVYGRWFPNLWQMTGCSWL